jgi:hypothetical protein
MARGYIVGKMRNILGCNFKAFDEAAARGRALGHEIVSPAELDRAAGIIPASDDPCVGTTVEQSVMDEIVERDIEAIMDLDVEAGDFIAVMPGFESSVGGKAEIALAQFRRLKVLDAGTYRPMEIRLVAYAPHQFVPHQEAACLRPPDGSFQDDGTVRVARAFAEGELK